MKSQSLEDRVAAGEQGRTDRAGRVDRGAGGRDRDEVDRGERETDDQRRERRVLVAGVGDREDHEDEDRGQHQLQQEGGPPGVAAPRRRRSSGRARTGRPRRSRSPGPARAAPRRPGWHRRAGRRRRSAPRARRSGSADSGGDRHGRVEVATGDPADGVGHHEHGHAEGERGPDDGERVAGGGVDDGAAPEEDEHERADHLRDDLLQDGGRRGASVTSVTSAASVMAGSSRRSREVRAEELHRCRRRLPGCRTDVKVESTCWSETRQVS